MTDDSNGDWRSEPRKGKLKRDKQIAFRLPSAHYNHWKELAENENRSLSDFLFLEMEKLHPPK